MTAEGKLAEAPAIAEADDGSHHIVTFAESMIARGVRGNGAIVGGEKQLVDSHWFAIAIER